MTPAQQREGHKEIRMSTQAATVPAGKYTPEQMVAVLLREFVGGDAPPAIDEQGRPVYQMATFDGDGRFYGCAITTICRIRPEFQRKLAEIGLHENATAEQLPDHGVDINDLCFVMPGSLFEVCDHKPISFMHHLQLAHDGAAGRYHTHRDIARFRREMSEGLYSVARQFHLDIRLIQEALR